ncbi:MAG: ATP-binding protein [Caldilineaceae bacterium]
MLPEFYQSLVSALPVGVLVLQLHDSADDHSFHFIYANQTGEALLGLPFPVLMGKPLTAALPASLVTSLSALYREARTSGASHDLGEIYYNTSDSENYLRIQITALPENCVLLVLTNVTEQREAEEERKQTALALEIYNRKLEASNRELEEFAYVASHDLQEPLRKIVAFGDRLRSKYSTVLDDVGQDYLARMQNAATRLQTLISDLLNLSRVATRGQPFEAVDLNLVVVDVLKDLETSIEQQRGAVEVEPLPTIAADPSQMRQLFQNLIGNALKFRRPDRTPVVRISSQLQPTEAVSGKIYSIFVADNGIGFEEKYLDRIFQPFQRLHGAHLYEGTGMGLAICRRIVERHGGKLNAQSQPGLGATFIVSLPVAQPSVEEIARSV